MGMLSPVYGADTRFKGFDIHLVLLPAVNVSGQILEISQNMQPAYNLAFQWDDVVNLIPTGAVCIKLYDLHRIIRG